MRVVAGQARGRRLQAPSGTATRPTSDRVREAVFNILTSMDAIEDEPVVDLFAGSGALGIEALSRGAASATFVDADPAATEAIRANLEVLGDAGRLGRIVLGDVLAWVGRLPAGTRAGVIFADPPYAWARWGELLGPLAAVADLLVAETGDPLAPDPAWDTVKSRRYASTVVTVLRPRATPGRSCEPGGPPADDQSRGGT
jgi:16S rRNA (guanine966-N2)-methyltransferase